MTMLFVSLLTALIASPAATPNPLALAEEGQLQCYLPDEAKKTCQSLASYSAVDATHYSNTAIVVLSKDDRITLETTTPVILKSGAVCGAIRAENIIAGKLRVAGQLLEGEQATVGLNKLAEGMEPLLNKEICTTYEPAANGLIAKISIEGAYQEGGDMSVKWVKPEDGYTVSP